MAQVVIFDMDGLLLNSEAPIRDAWLSEAGKRGYPLDEAIYLNVVGRNIRDSQEFFHQHFGSDFPFDEIYFQVKAVLEQSLGKTGYEPKAGAVELLQYLAAHSVSCVVATSTARSEARTRLSQARLLPYFSNVTGGDEVSRGKPEPDLFLLAARKEGAAPRDCLVLEDSAFGARAARAAGMNVIMIPDLKEPPQDVRHFSLGIFPSLRESRLAVEHWLKHTPENQIAPSPPAPAATML